MKKQRPINDCDGSAVSVRALAASAGIQFEDLQADVYRLRDKLGPDRKKAYDESIRRMARGGAVSETEERALLELGKRGFAVGSDAEFDGRGDSQPRRSFADKAWSPRPTHGESVTTSGP